MPLGAIWKETCDDHRGFRFTFDDLMFSGSGCSILSRRCVCLPSLFVNLPPGHTAKFNPPLLMTVRLLVKVHLLQPIPLGVKFSNAVSKLKAQNSNVSFVTFQWKQTFESLSFELWKSIWKCHPTWDWLYHATALGGYNTQSKAGDRSLIVPVSRLVCLFVWVSKTHPITGLSG